MRKRRWFGFCLMILLVMLVGCSKKETPVTQSGQVVSATIVLTEENKPIDEKVIKTDATQNLLQVLQENFSVTENKGMVTAIDGHEQNESTNKYWVFTINDEMVNSGVKDVTLKDGDRVVFNLEQF